MNHRIDKNIKDAIDAWINYGLDPGSCTTLLLQGRYDEAFLHAHPLIKPHWDDLVAYVKTIPAKYRGENMQSHQDACKN